MSSPSTAVRLAKFLAHGGVASRRKAEEIIAKGRVTVGGEVVTDPARDVGEGDDVRVDGSPVAAEAREVWAVNKPAGVVSTAREPGDRPAVVELVDSGPPLPGRPPRRRLDRPPAADQRRRARQPAHPSSLRGRQDLPGAAAAAAVGGRPARLRARRRARGRDDRAGRGRRGSASARSRSSCARAATARSGGWSRRSATGSSPCAGSASARCELGDLAEGAARRLAEEEVARLWEDAGP